MGLLAKRMAKGGGPLVHECMAGEDFEALSDAGSPSFRARDLLRPTCYCPRVSTETAARPRPLRLTQARIGDTLHDGNGTRVAIVNAFTTVNPETAATVRTVDYQVVGAAPDQFRLYSDDERDIARWRRVETPESP